MKRKADIFVQADDWTLGVWWLEIPAASFCVPEPGHWFAWVRRDRPGTGTQLPIWHVWVTTREANAQTFESMMMVRCCTANAMAREMAAQLSRLSMAKASRRMGEILVCGGATAFCAVTERGGQVPEWLSVRIIEHRPAGTTASA